mmetsp:Transcript_36652/g.90504  ORF Transcript_36652/g.90504 Transcript_36652/m.90504 type:complete len:280 (-) Transcript_36652:472-1311(-)
MGSAAGSRAGSARPAKYGSVNASAAVGRFSGSNASSFSSSSSAAGAARGNRCAKGILGLTRMLPRNRRAFSFRTLAIWSGWGVPSRSVMISSWCTTFLPGNSGFPLSISAKMQPMLQMSMAGVYLVKKDPHSSGARYHRVTTYSVMYSCSLLVRARPKSQILRSQLALSSRLEGFRSRCSTLALWMYFRPLSSWYTKYWQWSSDRGWLERMIWCRSVSMSSYMTYTSLKFCTLAGAVTSTMRMTFSWCRCRSSLISRSVRLASMAFSNALVIFFMATFS